MGSNFGYNVSTIIINVIVEQMEMIIVAEMCNNKKIDQQRIIFKVNSPGKPTFII